MVNSMSIFRYMRGIMEKVNLSPIPTNHEKPKPTIFITRGVEDTARLNRSNLRSGCRP